jgi:hypothetical protein
MADDSVIVKFCAQVEKAFHLGVQAMKLDFDAYYNAIRPKAGNDTWLLKVKLTFQFPDLRRRNRSRHLSAETA